MEIIICPHCKSKNRLKTVPKGQLPVCGKCEHHLPWLVKANDSSFASELETSLPVLVDFWAEWCGPCRAIAPTLESLSKELAGKLKIVKLNVDENPQTSGRFRVQSIPMLIVFKNGQPVDTFMGALPKSSLLQHLQPYLA